MKTPNKSKKRSLWKRLKRAFLCTVGVLSLITAWVSYANITPMTHSRAGRAAVWSAGMLVAPAIDAVPVWAWIVLAGFAIWLWWTHKLTMSILYSAIIGIVLAVI